MQATQWQILELHYKVDQLYQMIAELSDKIDVLVKDNSQKNFNRTYMSNYRLFKGEDYDELITHKDILDDSDSSIKEPYQQSEMEGLLAPEVQIQRLTAQLTACYNRIANLEEQLLAVRHQF